MEKIFFVILFGSTFTFFFFLFSSPLLAVADADPSHPHNPWGYIDAVTKDYIRGWTRDPDDLGRAIYVQIQIYRMKVVNQNTPNPVVNPSEKLLDETVLANLEYGAPVGAHGFVLTTQVLNNIPDGLYEVRAIGKNIGLGEDAYLRTSPWRFYQTRMDNQRIEIWARYRGTAIDRPGNYESYPTVMKEGNTYKMWFAGGWAGDAIYYATSSDGYNWQVQNDWQPVLTPDRTDPCDALDCLHIADPSVVKASNNIYYMYYTGANDCNVISCTPFAQERAVNYIFLAISQDGQQWAKIRDETGRPKPIISPTQIILKTYGAGQSSVLFPLKENKFLHFYSDTSAPGPCLAQSTDGGVTYQKIACPLAWGHYTWDVKYSSFLGRYLGALAHPGDIIDSSSGQRVGTLRFATSSNGTSWLPGSEWGWVHLTGLVPDKKRCPNNGGFLGDPQGFFEGGKTVYYYGAGLGMNETATTWSIDAVDLAFFKTGDLNRDQYANGNDIKFLLQSQIMPKTDLVKDGKLNSLDFVKLTNLLYD